MYPQLVEYVQVMDSKSQFYTEVGAVIRKDPPRPIAGSVLENSDHWVLVHFKGTETVWFRAFNLENVDAD